jgi:hypothetical protein
LVTVLVDLEIPPPVPKFELEKELELKPPKSPPKPFPIPPEKKSSSSKPDEKNRFRPDLPFLPKILPKKSASSLLSKPKSLKKCLKISSALWKLKLVPCFGASNP